MVKVQMGPGTLIYPMPAVLVGVNVGGKPNFMALAWCGIAGSNPPMVSVAIQPRRHTHRGIHESLTFSVNIPSVDMIKEADYCGMVSGANVDKVAVCNFKVFYGKLGTAPLIEQCPVNLECTVAHILGLGSHSLIIGKIEEVHVSKDCLVNGQPDVDRIKPFTYITNVRQYRALGGVIGNAFGVGREIEQKE